MKTIFTLYNTELLSRCKKMEACSKLIVTFGKTFEPISNIAGNTDVRVSVGLGSEPFYTNFGLPLVINYHLTGGRLEGVGGQAMLYVDATQKTMGLVGKDMAQGELTAVVNDLLSMIFVQLHRQFEFSW